MELLHSSSGPAVRLPDSGGSVDSCLSELDRESMGQPLNFRKGLQSERGGPESRRSVESCGDGRSMVTHVDFTNPEHRRTPGSSSCLSELDRESMGQPLNFRKGLQSERGGPESRRSVESCGDGRSMVTHVDFTNPEHRRTPGSSRVAFKMELLHSSSGPAVRLPDSGGSVDSCLSELDRESMGQPLNFRKGLQSERGGPESRRSVESCGDGRSMVTHVDFTNPEHRRTPGSSSCLSELDRESMGQPLNFRKGLQSERGGPESRRSVESCGDGRSMVTHVDFTNPEQPGPGCEALPPPHRPCLYSSTLVETKFQELVWSFMKEQMKSYQQILNPDHLDHQQQQQQQAWGQQEQDCDDQLKEKFSELVLCLLRRGGEAELANCLQKGMACIPLTKFKQGIRERCLNVFRASNREGEHGSFEDLYTDQDMVVGETETLRCVDLFKSSVQGRKGHRTVLTEGGAGFGKTSLTLKVTLDWIEGRAHRDIHFMFPLTFRELNLVKEEFSSMEGLIHHLFPELGKEGRFQFKDFRVVFIIDGLDECRFPLEFEGSKGLHAGARPPRTFSVGSLLTKLITGELLPSAHVWITSRAPAASRIPPHCIHTLTKVSGFSKGQKNEYFRRRLKDHPKFHLIMSHIENSPSIDSMCHIPMFCWITATVLCCTENQRLPDTLTDMYIHFLMAHAKLKHLKYDGGDWRDRPWTSESRAMIQSLCRMSYEQLKEGKQTLYKSELTQCGVDVTTAMVCSGLFSESSEEQGLFTKAFRFAHQSLQVFLASLHVHLAFIQSQVKLLEENAHTFEGFSAELLFYKSAVDTALRSPNESKDLFLRFLLGLSLQTNQSLLQGLLPPTESIHPCTQDIIDYIKVKISETPVERSNNLFSCLMELKDPSLVEETRRLLGSGHLSIEQLNPFQQSVLTFTLLSQNSELQVFDLRKFGASEEALQVLLPVVKASKKAFLCGCNLTERSCGSLASLLSCSLCRLEELDLSNNDLGDSGTELLAQGLQKNGACRLKVLRLSGCLVGRRGCAALAAALSSSSALEKLDLSYNHLGEAGRRRLDQCFGPEKLRTFPSGPSWHKSGMSKYATEVTLEPNTAPSLLLVYDNNKKVQILDEPQKCQKQAGRHKVLLVEAKQSVMGRCYWEVEWEGAVAIGVTYSGQPDYEVHWQLGCDLSSWSLICMPGVYYAMHNKSYKAINPPTSVNKVGVYLDQSAGTLSFYSVCSPHSRLHLHTFYHRFTDRLIPAFGFISNDGSVSITDLKF